MAKAEVEIVIKGTDKASGVMRGIGKAAKGIGIGIAAVGAAAVGMGVASVKSFADAGDQIQKMSIKTGFSTEALSELKHAADLSGGSIQGLQKGFQRMARFVTDAREGVATSTDVLDRMGVTIEELDGLSPEETFNKLTSAIADMDDPLAQQATALELFGKAGTDLLPMLEGGSEGLAEMKQEARDLGLVFSKEAADSAADFNDDITRLQGAFTGLMNEVAKALMPVLKALLPILTNLVKALPIDQIAELITTLLPPLVSLFLNLMKAIPLDKLIQFVSKALGPIMQILTAVVMLAAPLLQLLTPVLDILIMILDVLAPIIDGLTWVIDKLATGLGTGVNWLATGLGTGVNWISDQIGGLLGTTPTPALAGAAPMMGGFGDNVNITVEGNVWAEEDLVTRLREDFLAVKSRNTTTGF